MFVHLSPEIPLCPESSQFEVEGFELRIIWSALWRWREMMFSHENPMYSASFLCLQCSLFKKKCFWCIQIKVREFRIAPVKSISIFWNTGASQINIHPNRVSNRWHCILALRHCSADVASRYSNGYLSIHSIAHVAKALVALVVVGCRVHICNFCILLRRCSRYSSPHDLTP